MKVNVDSIDPAIGAPMLCPTLRKTVFIEVARPISLGFTLRTSKFCIETMRNARPTDVTER